jgi:anti-anti-sigma factor
MTNHDLAWSEETRSALRIVAPAGRVDESTATGFLDKLTVEIGNASAAGVSRLVIDLVAVDYMSSRGLRGLTLAQRKASEAGLAISLARPNEMMREILAISRYDKIFDVFETIDQIGEA